MKGDNLVIGSTSQVSRYMPADYVAVSSRNIPNWVFEKKWENVYLCFAEQRTSLANNLNYRDVFYSTNVDLTISCIENIKSKRIVCFSTTELWNRHSGSIDIDTPFDYIENYYTDSKVKLTQKLKKYENVITLFPFNFNSVYRKETFLFYKIYKCLMTGEKIEIGDTHFYRDLIHPSYIVERAMTATNNEIVGSGRIIYINDFIKDLFLESGRDYNSLVREVIKGTNSRNIFWLKNRECLYPYSRLKSDYLREIKGNK